MLNYLKNSFVRVTVELNPFAWEWVPRANTGRPTVIEPNLHFFTARWLFLTLLIMIDDDTYIAENHDV